MSPIVTGVKEGILLFYHEILGDPYHRYRSWEHCYSYFQTLRSAGNDGDVDAAALQLAFYLASWGMYRGSSELLRKNYRVHIPVVKELLDGKYSRLWNLDFDALQTKAPEVSLVIELAQRLRGIYRDLGISPTDTLITKVLLGTFGCIPAYDTLFIDGVTFWRQNLPQEFKPKFPARFGINSYRGLIDFYREHRDDFREVRDFIAQYGVNYPVMKLADMYFWNIGYQLKL